MKVFARDARRSPLLVMIATEGQVVRNVKIQDLTPFRSLPQRALTTSSPRIL